MADKVTTKPRENAGFFVFWFYFLKMLENTIAVSENESIVHASGRQTNNERGETTMKRANTTKTRTIGGITWECSESEGLWFAGEYRIGRCDRKGRKSEWELFKNNESKWVAKSCGELMEMVARKAV